MGILEEKLKELAEMLESRSLNVMCKRVDLKESLLECLNER